MALPPPAWACASRYGFSPGIPRWGTRFLSALPESLDDERQRLVPAPHSIRQSKHTQELVDFVENINTDDEPVKRMTGRYTRITPGSVETQRVKSQLNYHHARATDRRVGRPSGQKYQGGGFLCVRSLGAWTTFSGRGIGAASMAVMLRHGYKVWNTSLLGAHAVPSMVGERS